MKIKAQGNAKTVRDPRLNRAPSWSFGKKTDSELDRLSCAQAFFPNGTHRAPHGECLLTNGRLFDKEMDVSLRERGRQWKATPGPGTYKTQRVVGFGKNNGDCTEITRSQLVREPLWAFGTGPQSNYMEQQLGTIIKNPGPGTYRTWTMFQPLKENQHDQMHTPNIPKSYSQPIGLKVDSDLDRLAACNPFFAAGGTHRAAHGQLLLKDGRLFDKETQDNLKKVGRQWKAVPGPGSYRTSMIMGVDGGDQADVTKHRYNHEANWKFGSGAKIDFVHIPCSPGPANYNKYVEIA